MTSLREAATSATSAQIDQRLAEIRTLREDMERQIQELHRLHHDTPVEIASRLLPLAKALGQITQNYVSMLEDLEAERRRTLEELRTAPRALKRAAETASAELTSAADILEQKTAALEVARIGHRGWLRTSLTAGAAAAAVGITVNIAWLWIVWSSVLSAAAKHEVLEALYKIV